jgi:hypothetical protein
VRRLLGNFLFLLFAVGLAPLDFGHPVLRLKTRQIHTDPSNVVTEIDTPVPFRSGQCWPAFPIRLLRNSRKTECGAIDSWIGLAVRAAPFALSNSPQNGVRRAVLLG